ncbi:hypothetical protein J8J14_01795 [Roseomonas sp. SSH11]|uniref:Uncharacterized protein n=1 Tax=Pararoseomonas baculiformis TaxID=2820812 RepID=A0ABS4AB39_9PROT|nr:hypothetical protein [Pararoseomonas baculiformis]MBP0443499.1 hypothetical protein [Pararoseomonas baculiformis]
MRQNDRDTQAAEKARLRGAGRAVAWRIGHGQRIAGAVLTVGTLIAQFVGSMSSADAFTKAIEDQSTAYDAIEAAWKRRRPGIDEEAAKVVQVADYYASLTAEQRRGAELVLRRQ